MSESKEGMDVQRRKVFITILGASFYDKCNYEQEGTGFVSSKTRFIQLATLELLNADKWEKESNLFLIGLTKEAKEENWEFNGSKTNRRSKEEEEYIGLRHELKHNYPNLHLEECKIPKGKNEEEIMEIFSRIFSHLRDGDELYFDLTHGFRYLPMLVLVLGNYTKFVLNDVQIKHMSYGNFELKNDKGNCTFIDLKPLSLLQDWTFAAGQYIESGLADKLIELSKNNANYIEALKLFKGKNKELNNLRDYINALKTFNKELLTCRGIPVYESKQFKCLHSIKDKIDKDTITVFNPIISRVYQDINYFIPNANEITNCLYAAKWCLGKKLYQQAATFLEEYIISFFCLRHNLDIKNINERGYITSAITYLKSKTTKEKEREKGKNPTPLESPRKEIIPILEDEYLKDIDFINTCDNLIKLRNDYNHCGFRDKNIAPLHNAEDIPKKLNEFLGVIEGKLIHKLTNYSKVNHETLFVNYSNHPSTQWPDKQKTAAHTLGQIIDMKFPIVDEFADEDTIIQTVNEQIELIKKETNNNDPSFTTIHIMGEMTFTYAMVNALTELGYTCVASTTKRIVEDLPDGTKKTTFAFARFREYK